MIIRTTAIPLASYPYSSTSRIVHWLTRNHGKIATLLKGAQRPKSPFLGEYDLFSTSELLYFEKRTNTLYAGKECALLHHRAAFNSDWRAMQTASYFTALFSKTTPEEAPCPELFGLYEEILDLAEDYGCHIQFMIWAELLFSTRQGHAPHLKDCVLCGASGPFRFCASNGGTVCTRCAQTQKIATLDCPPDVLAVLRAWRSTDHPTSAVKTQLTGSQLAALNTIMSAFMLYQFNIPTDLRTKALFI